MLGTQLSDVVCHTVSARLSTLRPSTGRERQATGTVSVMRVKDAVGRFGEQLAVEHLERAGLTVLARNWRCARGELDVVACEGGVLVVVEVKTRSTDAFGSPAEAVGPAKAARIRGLATRWIQEQRAAGDVDAGWDEIRFDVVAVLRRGRGGAPEVTQLKAAF